MSLSSTVFRSGVPPGFHAHETQLFEVKAKNDFKKWSSSFLIMGELLSSDETAHFPAFSRLYFIYSGDKSFIYKEFMAGRVGIPPFCQDHCLRLC